MLENPHHFPFLVDKIQTQSHDSRDACLSGLEHHFCGLCLGSFPSRPPARAPHCPLWALLLHAPISLIRFFFGLLSICQKPFHSSESSSNCSFPWVLCCLLFRTFDISLFYCLFICSWIRSFIHSRNRYQTYSVPGWMPRSGMQLLKKTVGVHLANLTVLGEMGHKQVNKQSFFFFFLKS